MDFFIRKALAGVMVLLFLTSCGLSAQAPIYTGFFSSLALKGYDTVAYFTQNEAVEGVSKYQTQYKGATWYFSSDENLQAFKKEPTKYAPQYGGYCAYAMASGDFVSAQPQNWTIYKGILYVNYNDSVQKTWEAKKDYYITNAQKHWAKIEPKD